MNSRTIVIAETHMNVHREDLVSKRLRYIWGGQLFQDPLAALGARRLGDLQSANPNPP